jgi:hypothetical protein
MNRTTHIANGYLQDVTLRPTPKEIGSRLPWRTGTGTVVTRTQRLTMHGQLPLIPAALRMSFSYFENSDMSKRLCETPRPRLDRRSIRLTADGIAQAGTMTLSEALRPRAKTAFINIYCLVHPDAARKRARDFDAANGTACEALLALLLIAVEAVLKDDAGAQALVPLRALLVAQMVPLMSAVYNVSFFDLMFIPFRKLLDIFLALHRVGPLAAFKRRVFEIDNKGYCGSARELTPAELEEMRASAATAKTTDEDNTAPPERRTIVLQLRYIRARNLHAQQVAKNTPDVQIGEDEGEPKATDEEKTDDAEPSTAVGLFGVGIKRSATGTQPGGAGTRGPFELRESDAEGAPVLMSSHGSLTVGMPMDMRKLTPDEWIMLLITELLTENYHDSRHFGFTCAKMIATVDYIQNPESKFPAVGVTRRLAHDTVLAMVRNDEMRVVHLQTGTFQTAEEIEAMYPVNKENPSKGTMFDDPDAPIFFGLPWIIDDEERLATDMAAFLDGKHSATAARGRRLMGDEWRTVPGIELAPEQKQALAYCAMMPLVMVNGAGGTGKSLVMRLDFERIRMMDPDANILCLAFKNDTVNQMRMALQPPKRRTNEKKKDANEEPPEHVYFRTADSFIKTGGVLLQRENADDPACYLEVHYIIVDEAAMLSTRHLAGIMRVVDGEQLRAIKMFGDGDQLPPIMAGTPFCVLMKTLPQFCVTLKHNFRTRAQTLMQYVSSVRARDITPETVGTFFDDASTLEEKKADEEEEKKADEEEEDDDEDEEEKKEPPVRGSSYWVSDVDGCWDPQLAFGPAIMDVVRKIDPKKERYKEMMAVTPYNEMANFVSIMLDLHYFGNSVSPVTDAIALTKAGRRGLLYKGGYAVIAETDQKNKEIARGRVGIITHIVDIERGRSFDPDNYKETLWLTELQSTAFSIPSGRERIIVLDGKTQVKCLWDSAVRSLLHPGVCRTIHRAQGDQKEIVLCVFSPGKMSTRGIWYTAISRAKELCITFASPDTLMKMATTEPEPCMSAQESFLTSQLATVPEIDTIVKTTQEAIERAERNAKELDDIEQMEIDFNEDTALFEAAVQGPGQKTE